MTFLAGAVVLLAAFGHDKWRHYRQELEEAEGATRSAALVLAEHTARTFEAAEQALGGVRRLRRDVAVRRYSPSEIRDLLAAIQGGAPVFHSLGWTDRDGDRLFTSTADDPRLLNIAQEEMFQALQNAWDGGGSADGSGLYVAAPSRDPSTGRWWLGASMPVSGPDGRFDGIVDGAIDPGYFSQVYSSIDLGQNDFVTLFRGDGTILAREPQDDELMGKSLAGRPFMTDIVPRAPAGSFHAYGLGDGQERIIGYATVDGSGFIVTVAMRRDEALADFHEALWDGGIRIAVILLALAAGAWLLAVQFRRRERLAADLRASEARFQDFAAASGDWFWEADTEHRLTWVSNSIGNPLEGGTEDLLGRDPFELMDPGSVPEEVLDAHRETLRRHKPFRGLCYSRTVGDRVYWMMASGVPVLDGEGRFVGYRGSVRDITALRRVEVRMQEAVDAIPGDFILFGPDGRISFRNASAGRAIRTTGPSAQLGDHIEDILRRGLDAGEFPDAAGDPEGWLAWRLAEHNAPESTILVRCRGGMAEVIQRRTAEGGVLVMRFDVTEREAAREALRQARDAADAANRAKSDFLAGMSHELRTPLNAIIGFSQMLQMNQGGNLSERERDYCDIVVRSSTHLLRLVDDVLDLSGIEAGRLTVSTEPVDLLSVAAEAMDTVRATADRLGITLVSLPEVSLPRVAADRQRLVQVLNNLLTNAIKYNRPSGTVGVTVTVPDKRTVRLSVSDTGIGIRPEAVADLFTPFQRLGAEFSAVEGFGIGLALTRSLLEQMRGRIGYESRPEGGSLFWIELPVAVADRDGGEARKAPDRNAMVQAGGFSLLCVEDNPVNLGLIQQIVGTLPDVSMQSTRDGRTGLALAMAHLPDVIVLDLHLPGLDGYGILQRLKEYPQTASIPVIALTSSAMPDDVRRGLDAGFFEYMTKPLDIGLFLATIDRALRTRSVRSEAC